MGKIVAYLRASTDKQDVGNQRLEILEYARQKKIHVDDFIAVTLSSRQTPHKRRIASWAPTAAKIVFTGPSVNWVV